MHEVTFVGQPIILVVAPVEQRDDLVEELASRYGRDYDLRSALTFAEALSVVTRALSEERTIALLVVGPDVGGTSGIDVSTAVHALSPTTRRMVALPRGWDWSTAGTEQIREANTAGRIDTYLGTPQAERDEEFHAAITEILSDWAWTSSAVVVEGMQIVSDGHSAELSALVDFCQRMGMPYRRHHTSSEVGRQIVDGCPGEVAFPLVRLPSGDYLVRPTMAEIGSLLYGRPSELPQDLLADLLVVGAGPAGLAAAVYGASEGLSTVVVESEAIGGQAGTSSMIRNYLGFPRGISGMRLSQRARVQALRFGARFLVGFPVSGLSVAPEPGAPHVVEFEDGTRVRARTVLIATGSSYRRLGVEPVEELVGRGVHYGAAMSVARDATGADAYIVGGGNSAGQAALHLARFARRVTILVRRPDLSATMSDYLVREIQDNPRIAVRGCTEVVDARGIDRLEGLTLRDTTTGAEEHVAAGLLLLLLGAKPCTTWLPGEIATDERGFVLTGRDVPQDRWHGERPAEASATSIPGIYAAGDVRSGSMKRVASASGEGAGVVPLVHAHLDDLASA